MPHKNVARGSDFTLDRIQRWMQAVIVHPGEVEAALRSRAASREVAVSRLEDLVRPSATLTAAERVAIYHDMYLLRMEEALASDYPALKHFLGDDGFWAFVSDYLQAHPSRSYTLNRLGDHVPAFFQKEKGREHAAFLRDLARFELAVTEAFDADDSPVLAAEAVQAVPPEAWPSARLRPTAALRLLDLTYDVVPNVQAAKEGRPSPRPRRRAARLAVYRRDDAVFWLELSREAFAVLVALTAGKTLGEAIDAAAAGHRSAQAARKAQAWFRTWVAEGIFSAVEAG